jgi:hypothetical protein
MNEDKKDILDRLMQHRDLVIALMEQLEKNLDACKKPRQFHAFEDDLYVDPLKREVPSRSGKWIRLVEVRE